MAPQPVSTPSVTIDSINVDSLQQLLYSSTISKINSEYVEILKNTNDQLSSSWSPWSTAFTALAVLFTIGSIYAGYILYTQTKEYKKDRIDQKNAYNDLLEEFRKNLDGQVKAFDEAYIGIQKKNEKYDKLIADIESSIDTIPNSPTKTNLKWKVSSLKEELNEEEKIPKAEPILQSIMNAMDVARKAAGEQRFSTICENCEKEFEYTKDFNARIHPFPSKVKCPYCSTNNSV